MKQYCRYCAYIVTGNGIFCEARNVELTERYTKRANACPLWNFNEIDAYDLNQRYKPRTKKPEQLDGQMGLEL